MQAVKDKISEISYMRKAKAEAKCEEKAEKELAKARVDIAHEVRLAREAEAKMDLHVGKAEEKAEREIKKLELGNADHQRGTKANKTGCNPGTATGPANHKSTITTTTTKATTTSGAATNYNNPSATRSSHLQ